MNEDTEPVIPRREPTVTDESGVITELPLRDATSNETENVRGGADLPPDKRRQIARDM